MRRLLLALALLLPSASTLAGDSPQGPTEWVDVFSSGFDGYHTYRIPAVIRTTKGSLLAFCEGRVSSRSDSGDIDLIVRRSTDGGKTWSEPIMVWDDGENTCGNPAPVVDQSTGTIWLPMTWNHGEDHEGEIKAGTSQHPRRVFVTHSTDDGLTWAKPTEISDSVRKQHWRWYATGPGNAIQLQHGPHKGRLLIPANHSDHTDPEKHPFRSHVFWSDDHGKTWTLGGVHDEKTNESAVAELAGGRILQAMRSYHGGNRRALSWSDDGGQTWGEIDLENGLSTPVCQANVIALPTDAPKSEPVLLFSSPKGGARSHLHVWKSTDGGKTWSVSKEIYSGSTAYSNLVALPDGKVGLLFERDGYNKITWTTFDQDWLDAD